MLATFIHTAGLTGTEVGVAAATAFLNQKLLSALFGEAAMVELIGRARSRPGRAPRQTFAEERARFESLVPGSEDVAGLGAELRALADDIRVVAPTAGRGRRGPRAPDRPPAGPRAGRATMTTALPSRGRDAGRGHRPRGTGTSSIRRRCRPLIDPCLARLDAAIDAARDSACRSATPRPSARTPGAQSGPRRGDRRGQVEPARMPSPAP